jgi:PKD repeat protein
MKLIMRNKIVIGLVLISGLFSCEYEEIAEAPYSGQKVYLPAAHAVLVVGGWTERVNAIQPFTYTFDMSSRKLNIPLSVYRSGIDNGGDVTVGLAYNSDTLSAYSGILPLPVEKVSGLPETLVIKNGSDVSYFSISIDLNYILADTTLNHGIAIQLSSANRDIVSNLDVVVIQIRTRDFVIPTASFDAASSSNDPKSTHKYQYRFTNKSSNGISYKWDFGDGNTSTDESPVYIYSATGTYTVTLTAQDVARYEHVTTKTVTIPVE